MYHIELTALCLSKCLANGFKKVLPSIISSEQGAFIANRQILDGILIATKCIDHKLRSSEGGNICKLDLEKAFDHVSWKAIDRILRGSGFGWRWRRWVKNCISDGKFSILVNGSAAGFFTSSRGLRQGNLMSPFLFLLTGEVFSRLMAQAQMSTQISGFKVNENGTRITHLQYSDDTVLFLGADLAQLEVVNQRMLLILNFTSGCTYSLGKGDDLSFNFRFGNFRQNEDL